MRASKILTALMLKLLLLYGCVAPQPSYYKSARTQATKTLRIEENGKKCYPIRKTKVCMFDVDYDGQVDALGSIMYGKIYIEEHHPSINQFLIERGINPKHSRSLINNKRRETLTKSWNSGDWD